MQVPRPPTMSPHKLVYTEKEVLINKNVINYVWNPTETHMECKKHQMMELRDATTMSKHFHLNLTWDMDVSI